VSILSLRISLEFAFFSCKSELGSGKECTPLGRGSVGPLSRLPRCIDMSVTKRGRSNMLHRETQLAAERRLKDKKSLAETLYSHPPFCETDMEGRAVSIAPDKQTRPSFLNRAGASGQSSWLQIQRSRFNSRRYQTF
jgi:hypothetical protein